MPPKSSCKSQRQRAAALMIVLAFIVLLSGVVVAYLSRSLTNRRLSSSSLNQSKVDELARSALDIITSGLKQEIVNGSDATTIGDATIYTPSSNDFMVPVRNGTPPLTSGTNPIPTLLRVSSTQPIAYPGVDYAASDASTTTASANGRSITPARWNQHYLIPRDPAKFSPSTKLGTDPLPAFIAPRWVFVTDHGPAVFTSPGKSVIGRYAYAIYDEGALLDANVAGFPTTPAGSAPSSYPRKGSVAFADLTALEISGSTGINNIVGWRNYASLQLTGTLDKNFRFDSSATNRYENLILSNTNGFLTVSGSIWNGRTDQVFLSRQELIRFSRATGGSIIPQDALQYLGTFSRAVTLPSWIPPANTAEIPNTGLSNLRFPADATITHYKDDGTRTTYAVNNGDPFLQKRFSLARLAWLTPGGPALNISPEAIQACFGLQWDAENSRWNYVGPTGNTSQSSIKTLDQVRDETPKREPNLFELLKAGILSESLGKGPESIEDPSAKKDRQIIQIGCNMIDQADADSQPTAIFFKITEVPEQQPINVCHGVESLPLAITVNSPFRSMGELGYVYRDSLLATLDFWSANSPDAALLDLFSMNDNELRVVAGQVNPNNAPAPVLQTIMKGVLENRVPVISTLNKADAEKIATALAARLSGTPLGNRADLPAALDAAMKTAGVPGLASKPPGEAPLRALSSVTNTRTWNLMIDVVVQTGVFSPGAQTLDNFVVQGERRYWLHIALDRFTGKVVDQQLEPVDQ